MVNRKVGHDGIINLGNSGVSPVVMCGSKFSDIASGSLRLRAKRDMSKTLLLNKAVMRFKMVPVRILLAGSTNYRWRSYLTRLDDAGFSVQLTYSGVDCVTALREFRPDVLVLEANIPWGGGDGVLAVRDEEPELKNNLVVILTSRCESGLLYRLSDYPIDDLVGLPISAARLQRRLERLLELRREGLTCPK
jgi:CheY-like chemotaxis protein